MEDNQENEAQDNREKELEQEIANIHSEEKQLEEKLEGEEKREEELQRELNEERHRHGRSVSLIFIINGEDFPLTVEQDIVLRKRAADERCEIGFGRPFGLFTR